MSPAAARHWPPAKPANTVCDRSAAGRPPDCEDTTIAETLPTPDPAEVLNATVVARHDLNAYLSIVHVRPDSGAVPAFEPGQFATLGLPRPPRDEEIALLRAHGKQPRVRLVRRAYSIASAPTARDSLELFVILVQEGKLTPRLWEIEQGGRIWMSDEIKGEFTLAPVPPGRDLVMVSTGTGLAPFLSMYRTYRGTGRWRRFVLVHGVRQVDDLGYRAELEATAATDPDFHYIPIVSRATAADGWTGLHGRVQVLLDGDTYSRRVGAPLDPATCHVYLCGNPAMIDDMHAALEKRGFRAHSRQAPGNIHFERYW